MNEVETVVQNLQATFPFLAGRATVQRERRIWLEVDRPQFATVLEELTKNLGFTNLLMITGLDAGADLEFIYHLARN
jgi:hypothetical protein